MGEEITWQCREVVKCLTEWSAALDKWAEKPAFGTPLEEHLKRSGREIALPLEACVMLLLETGMKEEVRPRRPGRPLRTSGSQTALTVTTFHTETLSVLPW